MDTQSLYERSYAEYQAGDNWADKPEEMFFPYARDALIKEGYPIVENDIVHDLAVSARAKDIRNCVADFCARLDVADADKMRAKGGRPPRNFYQIIIPAAAYYRCKSFGPSKSKTALCIEAAAALGRPMTKVIVSKALKELPKIALGFQSQCGKNASPEAGVQLLVDLIRVVGEGLKAKNIALKAETKQTDAIKKDARHGR